LRNPLAGCAFILLALLAVPLAGCGGGAADGGVPDVPGESVDEAGPETLDEAQALVEAAADSEATPGQDADLESVAPAAFTVRFDLTGQGFFDSPFPSLLRSLPGGAPDYAGFPNPSGVGIIKKYLEELPALVDGAGCNGAVYLGLTAPVDPASLPGLEGSLAEGAAVFLLDVDPQSPERGRRVPIHLRAVSDDPTGFFDGAVLAAQPLFGFPLRGATRYALVATTAVRDTQGRTLEPPALIRQVLDGVAPEAVVQAFEPLLATLDAEGFARDRLAAATVFRTLAPTRELADLRQWIKLSAPAPQAMDLTQVKEAANYTLFEGRIASLNFLQGAPPYASDGGFAYQGDGSPKAAPEDLTFALSLPKAPLLGPGGRQPLVIYSHGTGGDYQSFVYEDVARHLADAGLACVSVNQPLHGDRWSGSDNLTALEMYSFNFTNPVAGVSLFRQAALDNVVLTRFFTEVARLDLSGTPWGHAVDFDPQHVFYFGHSQGGLVGGLFVGVEPDVGTAVLSGAGGVLIVTILERKDPFDVREMVAKLVKVPVESLTRDHPLMTLVQNAVDLTDPINYARLVNVPGNRKHLMMTEGLKDPYTPAYTAESLAVALRLPVLEPVAHEHEGQGLAGLQPVSAPLSGNLDAGDGLRATGFLRQYPLAGHFPVFDDPSARALYKALLSSAVTDDPPVVD
jgi:predicted esterase